MAAESVELAHKHALISVRCTGYLRQIEDELGIPLKIIKPSADEAMESLVQNSVTASK